MFHHISFYTTNTYEYICQVQKIWPMKMVEKHLEKQKITFLSLVENWQRFVNRPEIELCSSWVEAGQLNLAMWMAVSYNHLIIK